MSKFVYIDFYGVVSFFQAIIIKILCAAVVFFIGKLIIKWILHFTGKFLDLKKLDRGLRDFIISIENMLLIVLLALICIKTAGIDITPLLTAIGAVGLAVSLAVKSSLSNLAGGVFIFITEPFHIGDDIEIKGNRGTVYEIRMLHTVLNGANEMIFIPNGDVASSVIINHSKAGNPANNNDVDTGEDKMEQNS